MQATSSDLSTPIEPGCPCTGYRCLLGTAEASFKEEPATVSVCRQTQDRAQLREQLLEEHGLLAQRLVGLEQ